GAGKRGGTGKITGPRAIPQQTAPRGLPVHVPRRRGSGRTAARGVHGPRRGTGSEGRRGGGHGRGTRRQGLRGAALLRQFARGPVRSPRRRAAAATQGRAADVLLRDRAQIMTTKTASQNGALQAVRD